jgi:hypothetical protein
MTRHGVVDAEVQRVMTQRSGEDPEVQLMIAENDVGAIGCGLIGNRGPVLKGTL